MASYHIRATRHSDAAPDVRATRKLRRDSVHEDVRGCFCRPVGHRYHQEGAKSRLAVLPIFANSSSVRHLRLVRSILALIGLRSMVRPNPALNRTAAGKPVTSSDSRVRRCRLVWC
jgi:hypothetical protein